MFDEESIREWLNGLSGRDTQYVKAIVRKYRMEHDDNATLLEALVYARKAIILRDAINTIAYMELKTPMEVYNELNGVKG